MAKKIFYFKEMLERFDKINAVCADQALAFNDAVKHATEMRTLPALCTGLMELISGSSNGCTYEDLASGKLHANTGTSGFIQDIKRNAISFDGIESVQDWILEAYNKKPENTKAISFDDIPAGEQLITLREILLGNNIFTEAELHSIENCWRQDMSAILLWMAKASLNKYEAPVLKSLETSEHVLGVKSRGRHPGSIYRRLDNGELMLHIDISFSIFNLQNPEDQLSVPGQASVHYRINTEGVFLDFIISTSQTVQDILEENTAGLDSYFARSSLTSPVEEAATTTGPQQIAGVFHAQYISATAIAPTTSKPKISLFDHGINE